MSRVMKKVFLAVLSAFLLALSHTGVPATAPVIAPAVNAAPSAKPDAVPAGGYHKKLLAGLPAKALTRQGGGSMEQVRSTIASKKYLFVYFSAHWCPPCRIFTPLLVKWYNDNYTRNGDFELLFASYDKNEAAMKGYMSEAKMPWPVIKQSERSVIAPLAAQAQCNGIPCLMLLDGDGKLLATSTENGRYLGPGNALKKYEQLPRGPKSGKQK